MTTREAPSQTETLSIDVWSDVMCPFCYMGDTALTQAIEQSPHKENVVVRYHSYQLMPELPHDHPVDLAEILASKRGFSRAQAVAMNNGVAERGRALGLEYRFDRAQTINTRTAHRLIHFADTAGGQHQMVDRLFRAYFTDGLNIADHHVLTGLAAEIGLDPVAAAAALDSADLDLAIDDDIQQARALGITGVPFFVLDGAFAVSGAQPVDAFVRAIDHAWAQRFVRA